MGLSVGRMLVLGLCCLAFGGVAAIRVPLAVQEFSGIARVAEPIRSGVPIPKSEQLLSTANLRLLAPGGAIGFADTLLGVRSQATLQVVNATPGSLTVGDVTLGATSDFQVAAGAVPMVLAAGEAREILITFAPTRSGSLAATLKIALPGLPRDTGHALIQRAHETCPYSKMSRGNIDVSLELL